MADTPITTEGSAGGGAGGDVHATVQERYAAAAQAPEAALCCPTDYDRSDLEAFIPEEVLSISYGCGTPAGLSEVSPGATVLDIGSGGGIDCFIAARSVGPEGRVIGIDMTDAMLEVARRNAPAVADNLGMDPDRIEFRKGNAEHMPAEDGEVDLVISNCVINLSPDKPQVFREIHRVLKPGGRFAISDIVSDRPVPEYLKNDPEHWGGCLSGALEAGDYIEGLEEAGLRDMRMLKHNEWQKIDGISFFSLTVEGVRPDPSAGIHIPTPGWATYRGPFQWVRLPDCMGGGTFHRGEPVRVRESLGVQLAGGTYAEHFLFSDSEQPPPTLDTDDERIWHVPPTDEPCVWRGDHALLTGLFAEGEDDDHHVYRRHGALEVCDRTVRVLRTREYADFISIVNRATNPVGGAEAVCAPDTGCC